MSKQTFDIHCKACRHPGKGHVHSCVPLEGMPDGSLKSSATAPNTEDRDDVQMAVDSLTDDIEAACRLSGGGISNLRERTFEEVAKVLFQNRIQLHVVLADNWKQCLPTRLRSM